MVSVRFSEEIRNQIKAEAQSKFMLSDPKPTNKIELTDKILDAMRSIPYYKVVQDFFANPEVTAFLTTPNAAFSSVYTSLKNFKETSIVRRVVVNGLKDAQGKPFQFASELKVPATMHFVQPYNQSVDIHVDMIPEPTKQELIDAVAAGLAEVHAWEVRHKAYTQKTNEIFDACRTTAQLLNAWPAAEAFLPKEVVAKMQNKVVSAEDAGAKAKREAFTSEGLDEHILIANIVAQTSGGGTQGSI